MRKDLYFLWFVSQNIILSEAPNFLKLGNLFGEEDDKGSVRIKKYRFQDFPGGAVVKNPPANAGDVGSGPGPGRSHMPRSNEAHAPQLLSLRSRACEPQLLSPRATTTEARAPRARTPQQEKPPQ